ncbi:hypothetical protein H4J58_04070 [Colwellia sp. MB3u-70]|uniref:Rap1a/Tai family immunity protein n=1 Tax=unclassified Colwellia TaxID=196834 RepID=UPI0015F62715|nr:MULTISPECIES: Rap1a/Tai family immunity protein [unclassified Colwellia]MBA6292337.1 hypothetical protein [Colwellia sp. MB3u-8]MBA6306295.1 hypothetical protein [Colwellia sp. MB3u-70]
MKILIFLALLSAPFFSQATDTASDLLSDCQAVLDYTDLGQKPKMTPFTACVSYIQGVIDVSTLYSADEFKTPGTLRYCVPNESTNLQIIRVFMKYAKDNPHRLHAPRGAILVLSLQNSFPCKA